MSIISFYQIQKNDLKEKKESIALQLEELKEIIEKEQYYMAGSILLEMIQFCESVTNLSYTTTTMYRYMDDNEKESWQK